AAKLQAGTIGGWIINDNAIYSDFVFDDGTTVYRVYIQRFMEKSLTDSWVFSVQKSSDGGENFGGIMYIRGDGLIVAPAGIFDRIDVGGPGVSI
ncbi:hypothetical protein LH384_33315, partial [Pseudomonas aeruginosa]|nr:hypothetical protein [Pseudomonas aeruginosa]